METHNILRWSIECRGQCRHIYNLRSQWNPLVSIYSRSLIILTSESLLNLIRGLIWTRVSYQCNIIWFHWYWLAYTLFSPLPLYHYTLQKGSYLLDDIWMVPRVRVFLFEQGFKELHHWLLSLNTFYCKNILEYLVISLWKTYWEISWYP